MFVTDKSHDTNVADAFQTKIRKENLREVLLEIYMLSRFYI